MYPVSRMHISFGVRLFPPLREVRSIADDAYQQPRPFGAVLPHRLRTVDPGVEARTQVLDTNTQVVQYNFMHDDYTTVEVVVTDVDGDQTKQTHFHPMGSKVNIASPH